MSATPQNQSSDSESGDDDVVHNLPANLHLTGAAHIATSPDDREPPTPTIPQVKMQPPTPVTSAKEESHRRVSTTSGPDELGTNAGLNDADRRRAITSPGDGGHADAVVASHLGQESVEDPDYSHSDHRTRPEDGLASTPRPRAFVDRDTEPSRRLLPDFLSDPPRSDSSARKPPIVSTRPSGGDQDLPQQRTLSAQPVPQSPPHTTGDSSTDSRTDNHQPVRDRMTMTQVSKCPARIPANPPFSPKTPPALITLVLLIIVPRSINLGHQVHLAEKTSPSALLRARRVTGIRIEAGCLRVNTPPQLNDQELVHRHSTLPNRARATILL